MSFSAKLLSLLTITVFLSVMIFDARAFSSPIITRHPETSIVSSMTRIQAQNTVELESDQSFSSAPGSVIDYNLYVENSGKTIASYTLSASSNKGYYVEVWLDTDQIGSGEMRLIPPQESTIVMSAGEVVTLVVKVTIPSDAADGTVDSTIVKAVNTESGASDSVAVITTVASHLAYPSNWTQLGSDPTFPPPPSPARIDVKAFYYSNNGSYVFFRMTEVDKPDTRAFLYSVYLDTKAEGQQIESYGYDYMLSSDGYLYQWSGTDWINTGYPTYWQVDGTGVVLWTDLENLDRDMQEIHFLACTTTRGNSLKDRVGPYTIPNNNIFEIPLIPLPILVLAIYIALSKRTKKNLRT